MTVKTILHKEVLITVKSYPNPSSKYGESVCVAGIDITSKPYKWIRLYPSEFRDLPEGSRFEKYDVISLDVVESGDNRPETYKPEELSTKIIRHISTDDNWSVRREIVEPLLDESMCAIQEQQKVDGKSLGSFRPAEVLDVIVKPSEKKDWTAAEKASLNKLKLWTPNKIPLEKLPFNFKLKYKCSNPSCTTHTQTIIDWEIGELYRKVSRGGRLTDEQKIAKVKDKIWSICSEKNDLILFTGNLRKYPVTFLVLGFFFPKKESSSNMKLF